MSWETYELFRAGESGEQPLEVSEGIANVLPRFKDVQERIQRVYPNQYRIRSSKAYRVRFL